MRKFREIVIIFSIIISTTMIICQETYAKEGNDSIFPKSVGIKGQVTTTNVNVRNGPDLYSEVIDKKGMDNVMVTGKYKDWYRIDHNNKKAWMNKRYVAVEDSDYVPEVSMLGEEIVKYGKQFIGTPYVWGGTSLTSGVDCSGFTQGIYREFDIDINRTSGMQVLNGRPVSKDELRSVDLIFFDTNGSNMGRISHVGVYMGNGEFIHSASSNGISISNLENSYYKRNFVKGVRPPGI